MRRYENGYDLTNDSRYNMWLRCQHQGQDKNGLCYSFHVYISNVEVHVYICWVTMFCIFVIKDVPVKHLTPLPSLNWEQSTLVDIACEHSVVLEYVAVAECSKYICDCPCEKWHKAAMRF